MKVLSLFSLILILLSGCSREYDSRLIRLNDELPGNPEETYHSLCLINSDSLKRHDKAYFMLLKAESADKINKTDTSSALFHNIDEFFNEKKNDKTLQPRANYVLGRICVEKKQFPEAIAYFHKAIRSSDENTDPNLLLRVHAQMTNIFTRSRLYRHSLNHSQEWLQNSEKAKDTAQIINSSLWIATDFRNLNMPDSASQTYNRISTIANDYGDPVFSTLVTSQYASFLMDNGEFERADSVLATRQLVVSDFTRSSVESIKNRLNSYFGRTENVESDSKNILATSSDIYARKTAAQNLAELFIKRGNSEKALAFADSLFNYINVIAETELSNTVAETEKLYSFSENENINSELKKRNMELRLEKIVLFIIIGLMAILAITVCIISRHRSLQKEIRNLMIREQLNGKISNLMETKRNLETDVANKNEQIKMLEEDILMKQGMQQKMDDKIATLNHETFSLKKIIDSLNNMIASLKEDKNNLKNTIITSEAEIKGIKTILLDKENQLSAELEEKANIESSIKKLNEQIENILQEKDTITEEKNIIISKLEQELEKLNNQIDQDRRILSATELREKEEVLVAELTNPDLNRSARKKSIRKLESHMALYYPVFYQTILKFKLNKEIEIDSFLIKLGLSPTKCAEILDQDYGNLITRRSRLTERLGLKKLGFDKWRNYILSIKEE